eukprot:5529670-Pyramimonas_sp.AAC.1
MQEHKCQHKCKNINTNINASMISQRGRALCVAPLYCHRALCVAPLYRHRALCVALDPYDGYHFRTAHYAYHSVHLMQLMQTYAPCPRRRHPPLCVTLR